MSPVEFVDDGSGAKVAASIAELASRATDTRPLMEQARRLLAADEAEVFGSQGESIGEHWAALADATAAAKGDSQILVMSGRLRDALTNPGEIEVTNDSAILGPSGVPYARFHMTGTSKMPARPFLGISPETQASLMDGLSEYLTSAFGGE